MKQKRAAKLSFLLILLVIIVSIPVSACASVAYGVGTGNYNGIYQVDFNSGQTTLLGTTNQDWWGATDAGSEHQDSFYATGKGGSLYRINASTLEVTEVGSYGNKYICALAYDEENDILYGSDYVGLYTINTTNGTPTYIGAMGAYGAAWALDYDASLDKLVAMTKTSFGTRIYFIDPNTGAATHLDSASEKRITDIWYDEEAGKLFGVSNDLKTHIGKLYEINIDLTAEDVTFTFIDDYEGSILGLGSPSGGVVPEPMTMTLFGVGALSVLRRKRNRP